MKRSTRQWPTLLVLLLALPMCASAADSPHNALMKFFHSVYEQQLKDSPEAATSDGRHDYDDRWSDYSIVGRQTRVKHQQDWLKTLNQFDNPKLNANDKLSILLFRAATESELEANDFDEHLLPVGQMFGLHNRVYSIIDRMPTRTVKDYENIIARLTGSTVYIDQHIQLLEESIARGITQPAVVVDLVVKQLDAQLAQNKDQSALLQSFRHFPSTILPADQVRLKAAAEVAFDQHFIPAWKKYRAFMAGPYRQHVRPTVGISSIPDGQKAYQIFIHRLTTTNLTAADIHAIGEREVARIEAEMLAIARNSGFKGSLAEFSQSLENDPSQHYHSQAEMLSDARDIAKRIEPQLPALFRTIPRLLYGVRPIPADREAATATNAQAASADGSAPGWFNLNTYQPEKQLRFDKEALVLHEAVPGHIFQIGIARSLGDLPEFRRYYGNSAYIEGWALYAESLGESLGVYQSPLSRFGQLSSERFRAVRLVIDTGIHAMGWTREQAVEYLMLHAPENSPAEIDRYISWPAQALAYKLGQLEILRLKAQVEAAQGGSFDIREFHDVILNEGVLPLELLSERVMEHYHLISRVQ